MITVLDSYGVDVRYHSNRHVGIEILTVIRVKITFLPVPAVVHDFVEFIVQVARVKVLCIDQVTPANQIKFYLDCSCLIRIDDKITSPIC